MSPSEAKEAAATWIVGGEHGGAGTMADGLRRAHAEKARLCGLLEEIADSLPDKIDRLKCLAVANELMPLLRSAHAFEETSVFPAYLTAVGRDATPSIARLCAEHVEDECYGDELTEMLLAIGHGSPVTNAEATGFMLRGFFETIRRHVAFEREHVLPRIEGIEDNGSRA